MIVTKGTYKKKSGEIRSVELYTIEETDELLKGIDLTTLTKEERGEFVEVVNMYHNLIDDLVSKRRFRSLIRDSFISMEEIEVNPAADNKVGSKEHTDGDSV